MQIKSTLRNIKKFYECKKNINMALLISEIEPVISGSRIHNLGHYDNEIIQKAVKDFVIGRLKISEEDFRHFFNPVTRIDANEFANNPYFKYVKLDKIVDGNISIERIPYEAYELAILDEPSQNMDLLRKYSFGIFDNEAFTYVLFEDDKVWMSINPMEMRTAAKAIENGYGDVLVLGGGLGYYPLMVSLKENVSSVHIVESNPVIFKLLNEKIIPQFPNNKVTIELSDAYKYLDSMRKAYDTIYIDVWEDNVTGMNDYLKFVKYEEKYPSAHFDYWLENSLLDSIIANIAQYFSAKLGTEEYQKYFSFVAPGLWRYMEDIEDTIDRPEQAEYYMSRRFVKDLCKKIEKL